MTKSLENDDEDDDDRDSDYDYFDAFDAYDEKTSESLSVKQKMLSYRSTGNRITNVVM